MGHRVWRIGFVVILGITSLLSLATPAAAGPTIEDFAFSRWWGRWDLPIKDGTVGRTWIWGPLYDANWENNWGNLSLPRAERYDGQFRPVMYLDKARMEIPDLDAATNAYPEDNLWLVTTGLLATELITGQLQFGDTTFEQHDPARIPVAGDLESILAPTYADLMPLLAESPIPANKAVNQTLDAEGRTGIDARYTDLGVTAMDVGSPTTHTVASVFWEFMISSGTVIQFVAEKEQNDYVVDRLFPNPFYATGYPITEPYWTQAIVGGVERDVLLQCFERRCLTYTPDNPDGWGVEFGNIGLHYFHWRYEMIPNESWDAPAISVATNAASPQTDGETITWISERDGGVYSARFGEDPVRVSTADHEHETPDVAGDIVVWAEPELPGDCCSTDIRARNLITGETFAVAATTAFESAPSISGSWVVWVQFDQDSPEMTVMARDLSTMATPVPLMSQTVSSSRRPEIDDKRVVWAVAVAKDDRSDETQQLWMSVIGEEPVLLTETEAGQIGSYDIASDVVVYTTTHGASVDEAIHVFDLDTRQERTLPNSGREVATDGRYIAFQAGGTSQPEGDLVVYSLETGEQITIARYDAFMPWLDLTEGTLVWQIELQSTLQHGIISVRLADIGLN